MTSTILSSLLILVILLLLQAFVTAAYYALDNISRRWLKEHSMETVSGRAHATLRLLDREDDLLTLQQYLSLILGMVMTVILAEGLAQPLRQELQHAGLELHWASIAAYVLLIIPGSLVLLLLGYQLPIATLAGRLEGVALLATPIMRPLLALLAPLLRLTTTLSLSLGKMLGGSGKPQHVTEEEIKTLVNEGSLEGSIEADEKTMIYSVFKFGDTLVREVMVPRTDIVAIDIYTSLEQALNTIIKVGHSRIPVYEGSIDNIKGFLYAKDLLVFFLEKRSTYDLEALLRQPYFVPASKKADELLEELRLRETHIAVVNDEYGGTAGLVTLEDLLEQIVGDIRDEYDFYEEKPYEVVSEDEYLVHAWVDLDDLNELLDIDLPSDDNDTLGGYIFSELGKMPEIGDKIAAQGYLMEVLSLKGERRIDQIRVSKDKAEVDAVESKEKVAENEP